MMPTAYSILSGRFEDGRHESIVRGLGRQGFRIVMAPSKGETSGKAKLPPLYCLA